MEASLLEWSYFGDARRCGARKTGARVSIPAAMALLVSVLIPIGFAHAATDGGRVVATVGNHKITEQELDREITPQLNAVRNRVYEIKHQAIEQMASRYLVEQAAGKEHLTVQQYLQRHTQTKKVTEADANKFYEQNKARIKVPFAKIKDRIIALLHRQRQEQAQAKLLADLKKSNPVKMMIDPPRFKVATHGYPALGPKDAPVTIVEFADFECPFCGRAEPTVMKVMKTFGKKVRLVYVNFPLGIHPYAFQAAEAASCAEEQGKFWRYHNMLFANQTKLDKKDLKSYAAKLKLKTKEFDACFDKGKYRDAIEDQIRRGNSLGVTGTPTFFINGRMLVGAQPFESFKTMIDEELARSAHGKR